MPSVDEDFVPTEDVEEPDTEEPTSDGKGGGSGGGSKTAAKVGSALTKALTGSKSATNPAATAAAAKQAQQDQQQAQWEAQQNALMSLLGSKDDLAHIKSFKDLFGEDLFGNDYVPPSAQGAEANRQEAPQGQDQNAGEELYKGGHVDDIDVDTLLQILRG
jgi:hypothetical protein